MFGASMGLFVDLSIFKRNRNFTLLFTGQFVSIFGTMITRVALPYQIYSITHSTLMVGLLSLFQLAPLIITALIGGVFADRYHRRRLLIISEVVLSVGALLLAYNASLATPHVWLLFVLAALMSAVTGLHRPALDSILQQIIDKKDFPTVSSIGAFKSSVCSIAGPALGGLLIAYMGMVVTYLVDVVTFVVSLVALLSMSSIPRPKAQDQDISTLSALSVGVRYAMSRQELVGSYAVDFVAMIFGMPMALFPAIAQTFGGAKAFGILCAAPAVGALLISFVSGFARGISYHGRGIALSAAAWGFAIICFGLSANFAVAVGFLVVAGAADAVSGIFRSTMWNVTIPNYLRGRMAGIEMISYLSGPRLGDAEAGLVAAAFGVTASVVSGGVLCVLSVFVCSYYLPKFWHYNSKDKEELVLVGG